MPLLWECSETSRWCKNGIALHFYLVALRNSHQRLEEQTLEAGEQCRHSVCFSPQNGFPLKAVVTTDFCWGISDVLIFYVYSSICICSERSKFVSVHLNSKNELIFLWAVFPWMQKKETLNSQNWLKLQHYSLPFLSNFHF